MTTPAYELDHVFVCTSVGATEADPVFAAGLFEGSANQHPGQGTANRRIFFDNAMLELLWVTNEAEATSPPVSRLGLWPRWRMRGSGACPFGVCFRPAIDAPQPPPFETWTYRPEYSPIGIEIGVSSDRAEEPLLFYLPVVRDMTAPGVRNAEPRDHASGVRRLTSLEIVCTSGVSEMMRAAEKTKLVQFTEGDAPLMRLTFDGGIARRRHDFRPALPLVFDL